MKESHLAKTIFEKKIMKLEHSLDFQTYHNTTVIKAYGNEDFPVQWLGHHASKSVAMSLTPDWGIKISHAM